MTSSPLGSLLAFAATGRPPFRQGATVAVLVNIQRNDPDLAGSTRLARPCCSACWPKIPGSGRRPARHSTSPPPFRRTGRRQHGESARERRPLDQPIAPVQPVAPPVAPAPVYRAPTPAARSNRTDWRKPVVIALAALLALVVGFVGFRALDSGGTATSRTPVRRRRHRMPARPLPSPAQTSCALGTGC